MPPPRLFSGRTYGGIRRPATPRTIRRVAERYGRYEVRGELGRGGMAKVYRAWDPHFHREVAVKVLSSDLSGDRSFRTRFEREARAIAALEHHAIVPVHDFGEQDGDLYLVMRLLTRGSLAARIANGPMALSELVPVVQRVAEALDYAHSRGVIHRDVKPGNIMFDATGNAFLTDFGIARMTDQTSSLTGVGMVGSLAYTSPEQAVGRAVTSVTDIYSLGCTVYEGLSGRPPFVAEDAAAILMQHIHSSPAPIPYVSPKVMDVILRAMIKAPGDRFQTGGEMARALNRASVYEPPPPLSPASNLARDPQWTETRVAYRPARTIATGTSRQSAWTSLMHGCSTLAFLFGLWIILAVVLGAAYFAYAGVESRLGLVDPTATPQGRFPSATPTPNVPPP